MQKPNRPFYAFAPRRFFVRGVVLGLFGLTGGCGGSGGAEPTRAPKPSTQAPPLASSAAPVEMPPKAETPPAPKEPGPIVALTTECALFRDGKAKCWVPNPAIEQIEQAEGLVSIAAGTSVTLALDSNGKVHCPQCEKSLKQSLDAFGPLSKIAVGLDFLVEDKDGKVSLVDGRSSTKTPMPSLQGAAKLALSNDGTSCGILIDGSGICETNKAAMVSLHARVEQSADITVSRSHACVVRKSGQVACWGASEKGRLGAASKGSDSRVIVPGIDDAVEVVSDGSDATTCAARRSGKLTCWGRDHALSAAVFERGPVDIPLDDVEHVAAHGPQICAATRKGEVYCFGALKSNQPKRVVGLQGAKAIATNERQVCALVGEGELHCWGAWPDERGDLTVVRTPRLVHDVRDAVYLAMGSPARPNWDGCVVRKSKRMLCWNGEKTFDPGYEGVVRAAVGTYSVCALHEDGKASCFDWKRRDASPIGVADAVDIAAGSEQVCVLDKSSAVHCWPATRTPHHGNAGEPGRERAKRLDGLLDATSIQMGNLHGCAIRRNGKVACWGSNLWKQVSTVAISQFDKPVTRPLVEDALAVSLSFMHSCALSKKGVFRCWGVRGWSTLGLVDDLFPEQAPREIAVPGMVSIAISETGGCLLEKSGEAHCWGSDEFGQLGQGGGLVGLRRVL